MLSSTLQQVVFILFWSGAVRDNPDLHDAQIVRYILGFEIPVF
jgi:hypothetical protein